jgi:hypothetical protein
MPASKNHEFAPKTSHRGESPWGETQGIEATGSWAVSLKNRTKKMRSRAGSSIGPDMDTGRVILPIMETPPAGDLLADRFDADADAHDWDPDADMPALHDEDDVEFLVAADPSVDEPVLEADVPAFFAPDVEPHVDSFDGIEVETAPRHMDSIEVDVEATVVDPADYTPAGGMAMEVDPAEFQFVRTERKAPQADAFRTFVLERRLAGETENAPPPAWIGMVGQAVVWVIVVGGGIGVGAAAFMALTGHLPL